MLPPLLVVLTQFSTSLAGPALSLPFAIADGGSGEISPSSLGRGIAGVFAVAGAIGAVGTCWLGVDTTGLLVDLRSRA